MFRARQNSSRKSDFPLSLSLEFSSYFPRRDRVSLLSLFLPPRRRNTRFAGMLPRTAAIPRSVAGSQPVSYRGAQGKLTNGIRVDGILGHVSAHGLAICLKSHNVYTITSATAVVAADDVSFFLFDFPLCFNPFYYSSFYVYFPCL